MDPCDLSVSSRFNMCLKEAVLTFDPDSLISVLTLVTGEYRAPQSVRGPAPPEASSHSTTHPPRPPAAALLPLPPTPHLPGLMRKQPFWPTFMTLFRAPQRPSLSITTHGVPLWKLELLLLIKSESFTHRHTILSVLTRSTVKCRLNKQNIKNKCFFIVFKSTCFVSCVYLHVKNDNIEII